MYAYDPAWYDGMGAMGRGALWILGGGEGRLGEGEVVPGGVVDCVSLTSYLFDRGSCPFFLVLIEYGGHIHVSLALP